jgi:hypothetical protein
VVLGCFGVVDYRWQGTNGLFRPWAHERDYFDTPTEDVSYTIEARCYDPECQDMSVPADLTVYPLPDVNAGDDVNVCGSGTVDLGGSPTGSGGTGTLQFLWTSVPVDPSMSCSRCTNPTARPSVDTVYTVEVTDDNGCVVQDSVSAFVVPAVDADAGPLQEVCTGDSAELGGSPTASGGTEPFQYEWTSLPPDASMTCTDCANPTATPAETTMYNVLVTDANGCTAENATQLTVNVPEPPDDVGNYVMVMKALIIPPVNATDVVFGWVPSGGSAVSYVLRGSESPDFPGGGVIFGTALPGELVRLEDEVNTPESPRYYRAAGVNCAGEEGPL